MMGGRQMHPAFVSSLFSVACLLIETVGIPGQGASIDTGEVCKQVKDAFTAEAEDAPSLSLLQTQMIAIPSVRNRVGYEMSSALQRAAEAKQAKKEWEEEEDGKVEEEEEGEEEDMDEPIDDKSERTSEKDFESVQQAQEEVVADDLEPHPITFHVKHLQALLSKHKHGDLALLMGNISGAVYTARYGPEAKNLVNAIYSNEDERVYRPTHEKLLKIFEKRYPASGALGVASLPPPQNSTVGPWFVDVDLEDGNISRFCCYSLLPNYGRLAVGQDVHRPSVIMTTSLFGNLHSAPYQHAVVSDRTKIHYREGLFQIAQTLQHLNRNMDLRLAVFYPSDMSLDLLGAMAMFRPFLVFVPVHDNTLKKAMYSSRYLWHDLSVLADKVHSYFGLTGLPDLVMSWDLDSLLDSPATEWFIRHTLGRPEYIFDARGTTDSDGPHGIPRLTDGGCFAIAPKRFPEAWRWPNFPGHTGDGSIYDFITSFHRHFERDKDNSEYAGDEEMLTILLDQVISREGTTSTYFLDYDTSEHLVALQVNTGELGEEMLWVPSPEMVDSHEAMLRKKAGALAS
eukprot:gnl/TRDRNA2_/TRDRNA2_84862_c0_seq1.p1 gnl/TRDRNA2_/TRDRNA2_84862_c0~~gnl/TRDRNA2_/TRDRNA2_84862_c0_seq1.p1  ORF type:complete len:568 (+),score=68.81 gnl/TRDRNA2_/TRDRNA2_84862_c0_seq1:117-1820(+)